MGLVQLLPQEEFSDRFAKIMQMSKILDVGKTNPLRMGFSQKG